MCYLVASAVVKTSTVAPTVGHAALGVVIRTRPIHHLQSPNRIWLIGLLINFVKKSIAAEESLDFASTTTRARRRAAWRPRLFRRPHEGQQARFLFFTDKSQVVHSCTYCKLIDPIYVETNSIYMLHKPLPKLHAAENSIWHSDYLVMYTNLSLWL
jgi:hypothetical protein